MGFVLFLRYWRDGLTDALECLVFMLSLDPQRFPRCIGSLKRLWGFGALGLWGFGALGLWGKAPDGTRAGNRTAVGPLTSGVPGCKELHGGGRVGGVELQVGEGV